MLLVTQIFLLLLLSNRLGELYLMGRQRAAVQRHRPAVPPPFAATISLADHQKAADYTVAKLQLARFALVIDGLLLLGWTVGGGLAWLDGVVALLGWSPLWHGVALILTFSLINALLGLPLTLYQTFVVEQRFGFNCTTPQTFVGDLLKGLLLSLLLGGPLLLLLLWLMEVSGPLWWLYGWGAWFGFSLLMMVIYPIWIAPLFNRFVPLDHPELVARIEQLLTRCQFHSNGLFVMDGSRRSRHGNAYFSGLGRQKRIVFFDTLLQSLTPAQIEAVLAHELGHFRLHHIPKRLVGVALLSLGSLALLGWVATEPLFYQALGVPQPSHYMALLLFMLVLPLVSFWIQPLLALSSRRHEFEADAYAAAQSSAVDLVAALVVLYRDNATTLTPDPLYSAVHDSHPPAPIRIARLMGSLPPNLENS